MAVETLSISIQSLCSLSVDSPGMLGILRNMSAEPVAENSNKTKSRIGDLARMPLIRMVNPQNLAVAAERVVGFNVPTEFNNFPLGSIWHLLRVFNHDLSEIQRHVFRKAILATAATS